MSFKIKQTHNNDTETLCLAFGDKTIELKGITSTELGIDALTTQGERTTDLTAANLKEKKLYPFLIKVIEENTDPDQLKEALKALIKLAEPKDLKAIFSQKGFLSNFNQELSNIITEKTIDNTFLKRKIIKALRQIKGNDDKIAPIMIEALDVEDAETKGEAISFFKTYHKNVNENLITFLVKESKLKEKFKKDLYTNKVKMSALNGLLEKFNNQENIDDCLKKAKEFLVLIGYDNFNEKNPSIDLLSTVPNNIKELTQQKKDGKSALGSIKQTVEGIADDEQKKFVLELFFGKTNPAASSNTPETIGVNDIEKFINIYQNKLTKILSQIQYEDPDSVNFYKEYIKADFINTIPNNEKPRGGLFSWSSWGYSRSFFDSGNMLDLPFLPSSTTKKNNDKFLTEILNIKNGATFQGASNRKENERLCDSDAIKLIVKEYAACSSESSKREYRQAFYQVLEDLKCTKYNKTKKDWSHKIKTIEPSDSLKIPCSQDQLHLLVHAKIANFRYGYSQNELAKIINETKPERLASKINDYCKKHEESLLQRQKENLNILCIKISTSDNIGLFAGGLGGATRYVLNSFFFSPLRKSANSASYCKSSLPSFSIAKPDGCTLTDPKGASQ